MRTLVILLALLVFGHAQAHHCPELWNHFRGQCYRYFGDRLNFADAENRCHDYFTSGGMGRLASVHDLDENSLLWEMFRSAAGDTPDWTVTPNDPVYGAWIGLHQEVPDGPWVYTDGTDSDFFKWRPGEPNNNFFGQSTEDCVHIFRINDDDDNDSLQGWNDLPCNQGVAFICKMPASLD